MSGRPTPLSEGRSPSLDTSVEAGARTNLLAKLADTRAATLELILTMDDDARRSRPSANEWSVHEQLAHLAEMEPIWLSWALEIASNPGVEVGDIGPTPTPSVQTADQSTLEDLEALLQSVRERTLQSISRLSTSELARVGRHRWFGQMSVLQCLRAIYRHDRVHQDQMQGRATTFRFPPLPPRG
jgi:uncharacterized damage-inducible protein DinB